MFLGALLGGVGCPKDGHESALGCSMHFGIMANAGADTARVSAAVVARPMVVFLSMAVLLGNSDARHLIVTQLQRPTLIYVRILLRGGDSNDMTQGELSQWGAFVRGEVVS